jgi:hypothetical protein
MWLDAISKKNRQTNKQTNKKTTVIPAIQEVETRKMLI